MRIIRFAERNYALGLWWKDRPGGAAGRKIMLGLARKTAREKDFLQDDFNYVALRSRQYGLGHMDSQIPQCYSLAAALKLPPGQVSFLGVFCLEGDLWWMCGIYEGTIAPFGDATYTNKEEALDAAHSLAQLFKTGNDTVICETPGQSEDFLKPRLIPENPLELLFKPGLTGRGKILVGLAATAAVCVIVGLRVHEFWQAQEAERQFQSSLDAANRRRAEMKARPEQFFKMPWKTYPSVISAGSQCVDSILAEPLLSRGWRLKEVLCLPGQQLSVTRTHNLRAPFSDLPEGTTLTSAQESRLDTPLSALAPNPTHGFTELLAREKAAAIFYDLTQALNARLDSLAWEIPEQLKKDGIQLMAPWQQGNFSLSALPASAVRGYDVLRFLSLPGLAIKKIVYQHSSHSWSIQGVIYVKTSSL